MWFWLALFSAIFGAVDVTLNKHLVHKVNPALLSWALFTLTIPLLFIISLIQGFPSTNFLFLVGAIGSSLTYVLARTLINNALQHNLVSQIYPLTAFGVFFTYIFGLMFLSESLRPIPVLGLMSTILGSYILNVDQAKEDALKPFKLLFLTKNSLIFLFAIMLGGLTAILDKIGLTNAFPTNPAFLLLIEQIIMSTFLTAYLFKRERNTFVHDLKRNYKALSINSLVYLVVAFLVFYAYADNGAAALVIGIKRLQIFFILILSYIFFKDKPSKQSWVATAVMVLGVLMIKLG